MKVKKTVQLYNKEYLNMLTSEQAKTVAEFFEELGNHIMLSKKDTNAIINDFEKALHYYITSGVPLDEALSRLSISKLGGFYVRQSKLWFALDSAAKIYPLAMRHGYMAVFRLSVYLKDNIIPEILQMALTFTIKRFQSFATTVKKGFFWHYLDATKRRYYIEEEVGVPCRPIKVSNSGSQSFRVFYYNNRISIECFHILTDGTGGLVFLKTLTAEYLRLLGTNVPSVGEILDINEIADSRELINEYSSKENQENSTGMVDKPAMQFGGKITFHKPCRVLHFKMDAYKLKEVAKSKDATVTAYILSRMFVAGKRATDEYDGDFNIQVPVNMRKFYSSISLRNFSLSCGIRIPVASIRNADDIIPEITNQLNEKTSKKAMSESMKATQRWVDVLRYIPLIIKEPVVRLVYGYLGDRTYSSTLSNMGLVKNPPEMADNIISMDAILSTVLTNRASCAMVTVNDISTLSIVKSTTDPTFEESLYDLFVEDGITVTVEGSEQYEN